MPGVERVGGMGRNWSKGTDNQLEDVSVYSIVMTVIKAKYFFLSIFSINVQVNGLLK